MSSCEICENQATLVCPYDFKTLYCSRECQVLDWNGGRSIRCLPCGGRKRKWRKNYPKNRYIHYMATGYVDYSTTHNVALYDDGIYFDKMYDKKKPVSSDIIQSAFAYVKSKEFERNVSQHPFSEPTNRDKFVAWFEYDGKQIAVKDDPVLSNIFIEIDPSLRQGRGGLRQ